MKDRRHILISINYAVIFLIINYAIFYGLSYIFNIPRNELYYLILIIVALSHPLALLVLRFSSNTLVRFIYAASAAWLGTSAYLLIFFAIYLLLGFFISLPVQIGIVFVVIAFLVSIYALFNVTRLQVKEINIPLNGLKENITAVQISDVHLGPIRKEGFVKKMVDKIIDLKPEIVFITGDIFDGSSKVDLDILKDFKRIEVPVLFIMGNHDFYQGYEDVTQFMNEANINILYNQVYHYQDVQIVGVPFSWNRTHLNQTIDKIDFDRNKSTILLYHLSREFETAIKSGVDVQLSGHTHAGQFYPFNLFVKLMFPYLRGLYKKDGSYLYVSQGTGTLGPPMRLGSRCEITLINLKRSRKN
jgi:uncharacterized protein